ncbi:CRAL-TRIO domain-containing protein [Xylariales sp. PMI_506]|nr:CRAL-TRIO domain-containing protein [Xylariales sp. PMI_506]
MDERAVFDKFKERCAAEGLLQNDLSSEGDDIRSGIHDDGALMRFLRAREFDVDNALKQYKAAREWRDANRLIEMYDSIEVSHYEETRKMYTHWIGRRDRNGCPICLFEIGHLTSNILADYEASCSSAALQPTSTESEATLRLFCTYENLVRFVLPLCSAVQSRPDPSSPITDTTCIVDISGVTLMQFWRLRSHLQAASVLASSHYPETLGRTYVIGAPSFFPTVWSWISKWFHPNTVAKIHIVPHGKESSILAEAIDPVNIPQKYGGQFPFEFGMLPDLDQEIKDMVSWSNGDDGKTLADMPMGPIKWAQREDGKKTAVAVGTVSGAKRNAPVMALP